MLKKWVLIGIVGLFLETFGLASLAQVNYESMTSSACDCAGVNRSTKEQLINNAINFARNTCGKKGITLGDSAGDYQTETVAVYPNGPRCEGQSYKCEISGTIICKGDEAKATPDEPCACNKDQHILPVCPPTDARCEGNTTNAVVAAAPTSVNSEPSSLTCFTEDSESVSSPDRHCPKNCGGHKNNYPFTEIALHMPPKWTKIGAFYRNARLTCTGTGCGWMEKSAATVTDAGERVTAMWKTWGRPATFVLSASVCKFDD